MVDDVIVLVVYFFNTLEKSVIDGVIGEIEVVCNGKFFASVGL